MFDAAECGLKLLFAQFGVNVLDVFDGGEVVASATVLRRLQRLDEDSLESRDDGSEGWVKFVLGELACVCDSIKAEPREAVPAAREAVKRVLVKALPKRAPTARPT